MKIKIIKLKKKQPSKPYDFIIDDSCFKSPFQKQNGWNEDDDKAYLQYKFWFISKMVAPEATKQYLMIKKMNKQLKKHGKIRLFCSCKKHCLSKVIKTHLEKINVDKFKN